MKLGVISYENWNAIDRHGYLRWRPVEADTPLRKITGSGIRTTRRA